MKVPVANGVIFYLKKIYFGNYLRYLQVKPKMRLSAFFLAKTDLPFSTCNEMFYSTIYTAVTDYKVSMICMLPRQIFLIGTC